MSTNNVIAESPVEKCIPLVGWLKIFRKVESGMWKVERGKWKEESEIFWLAGFWKVTFGKWKVHGMWFLESKNIFWYHIVRWNLKSEVIPIMIISQSDVLVHLHELLDDSVDSSRQKLSQDQRKRMQQQLLWSCCYHFQNSKIHWKFHLKKKHKSLEKSLWLVVSNIFGK